MHGLADGAVELKLPVSGGNVSFYNQTGEEPILPTPVVGVLGVFDDVRKSIGHRPEAGQKLVLLGETKEEFGGSIWQQVTGAGLNGLPPQVDLANEERLAAVLSAGEAAGITAAHDLSEGGLGQSLAEMCFDAGVGAQVDLSAVHADATTALFSESASRILVATNDVEATLAAAKQAGVPAAEIGATTEERTIKVAEGVSVGVDELREVWAATLPGLFGNATGANSVLD